MENKVIQMPQTHTWKQRMQNRFHERKSSVAVSLGAILVMSLFMNQWLIQPGATTKAQRGLASVGTSPEDYQRNLRWEHELAEQVAGQKANVAHLSVKPSLRDDLIFGKLAGQYGVQFQEGRVQELEFNIKSNGQAFKVSDRKGFIQDYRGVWAVEFAKAELASASGLQEVYRLLDGANNPRGQAVLDLDQEGHLVSLKIVK